MISQKTKERIRDQSKLPTHDDCEVKKKTSPLSALERFIWDQEPVDDGEWREQLRAAIIEAREAEAERAQGLATALERIVDLAIKMGEDATEIWAIADDALTKHADFKNNSK